MSNIKPMPITKLYIPLYKVIHTYKASTKKIPDNNNNNMPKYVLDFVEYEILAVMTIWQKNFSIFQNPYPILQWKCQFKWFRVPDESPRAHTLSKKKKRFLPRCFPSSSLSQLHETRFYQGKQKNKKSLPIDINKFRSRFK